MWKKATRPRAVSAQDFASLYLSLRPHGADHPREGGQARRKTLSAMLGLPHRMAGNYGPGGTVDGREGGRANAADLIAAIPVQEGAPEPSSGSGAGGQPSTSRALWDGGRRRLGRGAAVAEVLTAVTDQAAHLLPAKADAGRAAAEPACCGSWITLHWANGWLHYLTGRRPRSRRATMSCRGRALVYRMVRRVGGLHGGERDIIAAEHRADDEAHYPRGRRPGATRSPARRRCVSVLIGRSGFPSCLPVPCGTDDWTR